MKFSCDTSDFLAGVQLVSRAISSQQALPILGNIFIRAQGDQCIVSATDLELSIVTSFPAKIESEGSLTIPAKAILNFAQYNSDPEVLFEVHQGTQLRCTSLHTKTVISGESANDYPTITRLEKKVSLTLPTTPLLTALHLVTFSSAHAGIRPVLSGVYFLASKNGLTLAATDSYRLSEFTMEEVSSDEDFSCIIPAKILNELKMILGAQKGASKGKVPAKPEDMKDGQVTILLAEQQMEIQCGDTILISRLIDGKFPNYQQIMPKESTSTVVFSVHELLTAAKRLHYFAKEMNNNLTFTLGKDRTEIITPQTQGGRDESILQAELQGNEAKIALSSSYILDFLGHIESDVIEMRMTDSTHPAVFSIPSLPNYVHLIMPLRLQEE